LRPTGWSERGEVLAVWGAALLGFGLGGLLDAVVRPGGHGLQPTEALARMHASPVAFSLFGIALLLPVVWQAGRLTRLLAGALLMGAGLFGVAVGLGACVQPHGLLPGNAALLIWSVALVAGGQRLFEQGSGALPGGLRAVMRVG
jgi:hypothetical protein